MIETTALIIEVFGLGSLTLSLAKYKLLMRKFESVKK